VIAAIQPLGAFWRIFGMQRYFSGVTDVALGIGAIGIAIAVLLNLGQIAFRYVLSDPLAWSEEVMRYLLIWVMMLSVASALYRSQEVTAGMLDWVASDVFQKCLHAVRVLFVFFFAVVLVGFGIPFAVGAGTQISPSAHIPMFWPYLAFCVGGIVILVAAIGMTVAPHRPDDELGIRPEDAL